MKKNCSIIFKCTNFHVVKSSKQQLIASNQINSMINGKQDYVEMKCAENIP